MPLWTSNGGLVMQDGMAMNCDECPCNPPPFVGCPTANCDSCPIATGAVNFGGVYGAYDYSVPMVENSGGLYSGPCTWFGYEIFGAGVWNFGSASMNVYCQGGCWYAKISGYVPPELGSVFVDPIPLGCNLACPPLGTWPFSGTFLVNPGPAVPISGTITIS
jgi:hypothetical protein